MVPVNLTCTYVCTHKSILLHYYPDGRPFTADPSVWQTFVTNCGLTLLDAGSDSPYAFALPCLAGTCARTGTRFVQIAPQSLSLKLIEVSLSQGGGAGRFSVQEQTHLLQLLCAPDRPCIAPSARGYRLQCCMSAPVALILSRQAVESSLTLVCRTMSFTRRFHG